ncbi:MULTISPECIES: hypothetical protein [unclassified Bartonella]|uniref:hypothetical protein n=1 Tax=unclassified Bartonella TaxID=2645622 RepID=UPI0035D0AC54
MAQSQGEYCNGSICNTILPVIQIIGDSLIDKDLQMFLDEFEMRKIHRTDGFYYNRYNDDYIFINQFVEDKLRYEAVKK